MGRIKPAALLLQSKKQKGPARLSVTRISACSVVVILLLSISFIHKHEVNKVNVAFDDLQAEPIGDAAVSAQYAVLNTTKGLITMELYGKQAPRIVEKFMIQSQNGYYNGLIFHRVVRGFVIQGEYRGDNGTTEESIWGGMTNDKVKSSFKHGPFMLSMANVGPDSNGSQFFITTVETPHPSARHTVFGRVVRGQEVVEDIENSPRDLNDQPVAQVAIWSIQIKDTL